MARGAKGEGAVRQFGAAADGSLRADQHVRTAARETKRDKPAKQDEHAKRANGDITDYPTPWPNMLHDFVLHVCNGSGIRRRRARQAMRSVLFQDETVRPRKSPRAFNQL